MVFPDAGGGDNEETLRLNIVVESQDSAAKLEQWRKQIEELKAEMKSLADSTGESFSQIRRAMGQAFEEKGLDPQAVQDYKANLMAAQRELVASQKTTVAEQRKAATETANQIDQNVALERAASIERQKIAREETQNKLANLQQQATTRQSIEQQSKQNTLATQKEIADNEKKSQAEWSDFLKKKAAEEKAAAEQSKQTARETTQEKLKEIQTQVNMTKELDKSTKATKGFGDISKFVFGSILGITALSVIRGLITGLQQAAVSAFELAKGMFQLEVGVRALQRAGVDITIKEMYQQIENLRMSFGTFSRKELIVGAGAFLNLNRDMGFTKEQLFELQGAIATLATVNGRSMDEVQKTVALALSSGYTEGLQRLGVSINRVTIAQEAATLGFRGGYNALTEQQRALATYNLVLRKTAIYQEDLLEFQKQSPGQIQRGKAAWEDLKATVGDKLLPAWAWLNKIFADAWLAISSMNGIIQVTTQNMGKWGVVIQALINPFNTFIAITKAMFTSAQDVLVALTDLGNFNFEELGRKIQENFSRAFTEITGGSMLGDTSQSAEEEAQRAMETINESIANHADDIEKIIEDSAEERIKIEEDLQRDLEDITRDGIRDRENLERDHARKIADINRNAARDIAEAQRKYGYDLARLKEEENKRIQDVIDKYREKELEDEIDFQEKMRKLREELIFDLEEAVRSRDAVAIRRLQRRYAFDKEELIRDFQLEKEERERAYQRELEDARRQNEDKRKELAIAFQQKMEDIALQREYELREEEIKHQENLEDLRRRLAEQREDRIRAYRQDLQDLNESLSDRLRKIAEAMAKEIELTAAGANAVYEVLRSYYGPGGLIDDLFNYYNEARNKLPANPSGGGTGTGGTSSTPGFAFGGSMLAMSPTTIRVGETVPEMVQVTPLMQRNTSFSDLKSGGAGMNGNMRISIMLSPGLEGKIIEDTLSQFEGILASVERSR